MAGEIQIGGTTFATESGGTVTVSNVDSATNRTNLGLGSMATQNANAVAITGGTINTVQPATGQSLTIKDEDGNTAITIGTDNTAAGYLSLNFGSYHGDSGGAGSGSLTANTLDDYEEGTWTPELGGSTTDPSVVYNTTYTHGGYIKIGRQVTISGQIRTTPGTTGGVGSLTLKNLPFATSKIGSERGYAGNVVMYGVPIPAGTVYVQLYNDPNTNNEFNFQCMVDNAAWTTVDAADVNTTDIYIFTATYYTA